MSLPDVRTPDAETWAARWTPLVDDFMAYHHAAVAAHDDDPAGAVLARIAVARGWDPGQCVWAVLAYMAYDDLGSALLTLDAHLTPAVPSERLLALPCSGKRRAHRRADRMASYFCSVKSAAGVWGGLWAWLRRGVDGMPPSRIYPALTQWLGHLDGNGAWAAYRTAELLSTVLTAHADEQLRAGMVISTPPELTHDYSHSSARTGLSLLVHGLTVRAMRGVDELVSGVHRLDVAVSALQMRMGKVGIFAPANVLGRTLADYAECHDTRGYVGHGIDAQQAQLHRVDGELVWEAWRARRAVFEPAYLGEVSGWVGPQKDRRKVYAHEGRIVVRTPDGDATALLPPLLPGQRRP